MRSIAVIGLLAPACILSAQPAAPADRFSVATIRPARPDEFMSVAVQGRRFLTTKASIKDVIAYAYMLHGSQIGGGPPWSESDKYDISAEADQNDRLTQTESRAMVQQLLAERFRYSFHRDRKTLPVYEISVAGTALKLTASSGDANGFGTFGFPGYGAMVVNNSTLTEFANFLQRYVLDRPVLNQTAVEGRYNFRLDWTPDDSQFPGRTDQLRSIAPDRNFEPPDIFAAMQSQLGLRLAARKSLAEVIVIDRLERPSEN
jgi:uncharacterized protein (TIGR03435 family)